VGFLALPWPLLPLLLVILVSTMGGAAEDGRLARDRRSCFSKPSRCGFPDAANTGVPAGVRLRPSGSRDVSAPGAVLDRLDLTGTVWVDAPNVTIRRSRLHLSRGGSGTSVVELSEDADGFRLIDSEVYGPRSDRRGAESAVWNLSNNPGAIAIRSYLHGCSECWHGSGTIRDSYIVVDAGYRGSHDENIYFCSSGVRVDHSTLFNLHHQTATVFGDTICGGGNRLTVTDSLLAGGGFLLYPQANSGARVGRAVVSGNRFARCRTRHVYRPGSGGHTCAGGRDRHGLYPFGGFFGVSADYWAGAPNVWRNNVWDDSGQPICPDGTRGCGKTHR
jgi:hypothetical protein